MSEQFVDVLLDGSSIRENLVSFRLQRSRDRATDNLTVRLGDFSLYSLFDFTLVPTVERLHVGTSTASPKIDGSTVGTNIFTSAGSDFTAEGVTTDDILFVILSDNKADEGGHEITVVGTTTLTSSFTFGTASSIKFIILKNQGRFFVEKPDVIESEEDIAIPSLWGRNGLARLTDLFLHLPDPPARITSFSDFTFLRDHLAQSLERDRPDVIEERFLELYAHLHMNEAPYTTEERQRMDAAGGYWNHAGGLSPILKAEPWIRPDTVSADFGAGNGLQGLLLQVLYPHRKTVQIEISARMSEIGEELRGWLGVPGERIKWIVADVLDTPAIGYDFIYLYRPVRPEDPGRDFYTRFAREVEGEASPPIIFSIADCLRDFLSDRYEAFYSDGHLTCFKPRKPGKHS